MAVLLGWTDWHNMALGASLLSIGIKRLDQGNMGSLPGVECKNVTGWVAILSACNMAFQCVAACSAYWALSRYVWNKVESDVELNCTHR